MRSKEISLSIQIPRWRSGPLDAFCEPHEVVALKKKKKLHFSTNYGSVTLGPGEFLVRDMTNRFYRYTKDEFHQMYELTENKHDMGLISEATYHG